MSRVFVAGHNGMVGSAIVRRLHAEPEVEVLTVERSALDLANRDNVRQFLRDYAVDQIYLAAAKVGGIHANDIKPAEFILENLAIETAVLQAAHDAAVGRVLFLGSSCVYPRLAQQPIREEALLTGPLEQTNEPYAIAKIAGIKIAESLNRQFGRDYRTVMPTNLYGPCDNFHPVDSHVLPALIRRFHEASQSGSDEVVIWGTGTPRREFLHVDDLADACVHVMDVPRETFWRGRPTMCSHVNVGTGVDCTVAELAEGIADVTGFTGMVSFDSTKPDGTPRKLLDISQLSRLGWCASIGLREGLRSTYRWFVEHQDHARGT